MVIPSLNINTTLVPDYAEGLAQQNRDPIDFGIDPAGGLSALSYVVLGYWLANPHPNDGANATQLVFGIDTPAASMPVSGTATFTGGAQGFLTNNNAIVTGPASLTVDFATGSITGALTKMTVGCLCGLAPTQWNDVSISANIATGTNRFTGNTAVTSAPGTPLSLAASATGRIDGGFFGPTAQSLGAVWSLSDGTASAVGTIYAGH
jgi:hypothetical protein